MGVCSEEFCVLLLTEGGFQVCLMLLTMKSLDFIMTARTDIGDDEILPGQGFSGSVDN